MKRQGSTNKTCCLIGRCSTMSVARVVQRLTRGHSLAGPQMHTVLVRRTGAEVSLPAVRRRTFSTPKKASPGPDGRSGPTDTETPSFSLKDLGVSRRMRFMIYTSLVMLGCIECATWVKVWPKITGCDQRESSSD